MENNIYKNILRTSTTSMDTTAMIGVVYSRVITRLMTKVKKNKFIFIGKGKIRYEKTSYKSIRLKNLDTEEVKEVFIEDSSIIKLCYFYKNKNKPKSKRGIVNHGTISNKDRLYLRVYYYHYNTIRIKEFIIC